MVLYKCLVSQENTLLKEPQVESKIRRTSYPLLFYEGLKIDGFWKLDYGEENRDRKFCSTIKSANKFKLIVSIYAKTITDIKFLAIKLYLT